MADKTIGQLPVSAGLDDNSLLVTEQGGEARSITGALVKQFAKDAVAEETAKAEQAAKDAAAAKTSVDASKASIDQSKSSIDQTKAAIDGIKTDIDAAKTAIDQANLDVAQNKAAAETAAQSAGTSARSAQENANLVAAALNEADGIVEEVTGLRDETLETVNSTVKFTAQTLTDEQKSQARENIGAVSADEVAQTDYKENDETSPAYLKNRPFFDKGPSGTVKWDDENEPVAVVEYGGNAELNLAPSHLYLMPRTTDHVPTYEELETLGGSVTYQTGANDFDDSGMIPVLATYKFGAGNGNLDPIIFAADVTGNATWVGTQVLVVHEANTPLENVVIEKPGVYFASDLLGGSYFYPTRAIEMTLTGGTLDDGLERLPEKFLPDSVATKEYVDQKLEEGGGSADAVKFTAQTLTEEQKAQARKNVGASEYIPLDVTEADTWTTKGEEAAIIVPMYDGGTVSLYKMPSAVGTVLPQEIEVTTKEVYDDGYVNEDVYLTEAHEAFRGEGVTLFDLQPVGIIAVVTKAGTVDFTDAQVEISEPGVYFYDKRSWENPIEGVQYATMKFTTPYSEVRLKESILPSTAATKQYVDEKATWENLQGKPTIFEGGDTLTWDGNTDGLYSLMDVMGMPFYCVSDVVLTADDLANAVLSVSAVGGEDSGVVADTSVVDMGGGAFSVQGGSFGVLVLAIPSDNFEADGFVIERRGVYLIVADGVCVSSLTIPGYTGFGKEVIDPDVLPESVKNAAVYVNFTTEDGETFTANKTFAEVETEVIGGKEVIGVLSVDSDTMYLRLEYRRAGEALIFINMYTTNTAGGLAVTQLTFYDNEAVKCDFGMVAVTWE